MTMAMDKKMEMLMDELTATENDLRAIVKEMNAIQKVINLLPEGREKVEEQEYFRYTQTILVFRISSYEVARRKLKQYIEETCAEELTERFDTDYFVDTPTSHEIMRGCFMEG